MGQGASGRNLGNLGSEGGGFKEGRIVQWLRGKLDWGKLSHLSCLPFLIGKMENIPPRLPGRIKCALVPVRLRI